MECNCGLPVRQTVFRDGRPCYNCAYSRCRFFGFSPVQCEGYQRVLVTSKTPANSCIVRFEALLHPDTQTPAVMAQLQTPNEVGGHATEAAVRETLEDPRFSPAFYTEKKAYIFPLEQYAGLVAALKCQGGVLVQEIPTFFFRCVNQTKMLPERYTEAVRTGKERPIDEDDFVFRQLKNFQKKGVEFVVSHGGRGMIADDMGLGKTVQAIATTHHYRDEWPVLVVCPMSLVENWAKEFNKFCGTPFSRIGVLQGTKARPDPLHEVVIVSYSSLKCVEGIAYKVVVLDESHYIKAGDSKRTQLALKFCHAANRVVLLSGTPTMSRPMELFTQLVAIHPRMMPTKTQYAARYCNGHLGRFGMDYLGHSHVSELHSMIQGCVLRRTKRELSEAELPSKSRQLLYIFITAKEKKALEKQVMALRRSMTDRDPSAATTSAVSPQGKTNTDLSSRAPNAFEMKIATARAKIPAVQDYVASVVEQHVNSEEKIIFFAHHQCMMEAIKAAVVDVSSKHPVDYIYITGETPAQQREQLATHFREERTCAVAILSMGSSGTGHNFTCSSTVVFAELDWNPSTHLQCEDRVHRIGQSNPCTIKYLLADGTSDDVIWPLLQRKLTVTSAVLESGGSSEEAKGLSANADRQKISRRDLSVEPHPTEGTLDGFVRGSHSSQAGRCSVSSSSNFPPLQQSRPPLANAVEEDSGTDEEVVVVVPNAQAKPHATATVAQPGTLPTPPSPKDETQTPESCPSLSNGLRMAPPPPPPPPPPQPVTSPHVISIEELHRSPHWLAVRGLTAGSAAGHSPRGSQQGRNAAKDVGGTGSPSKTTSSASNSSQSQLLTPPGGTVLELMQRSQQQQSPEGRCSKSGEAVVIVVDEADTNTWPQSVRAAVMLTPSTSGVTSTAVKGGGGGSRGTLVQIPPPTPTAATTTVSFSCVTPTATMQPRRTTFTLKPVTPPPPATAAVAAAPAPAPAQPQLGTGGEGPSPSAISSDKPPPRNSTHTLARVPVNVDLRKRGRPSTEDVTNGRASVSDATVTPTSVPAPTVCPSSVSSSAAPQQPVAFAARTHAPQAPPTPQPPSTGHRTTFRFTAAATPSSSAPPR